MATVVVGLSAAVSSVAEASVSTTGMSESAWMPVDLPAPTGPAKTILYVLDMVCSSGKQFFHQGSEKAARRFARGRCGVAACLSGLGGVDNGRHAAGQGEGNKTLDLVAVGSEGVEKQAYGLRRVGTYGRQLDVHRADAPEAGKVGYAPQLQAGGRVGVESHLFYGLADQLPGGLVQRPQNSVKLAVEAGSDRLLHFFCRDGCKPQPAGHVGIPVGFYQFAQAVFCGQPALLPVNDQRRTIFKIEQQGQGSAPDDAPEQLEAGQVIELGKHFKQGKSAGLRQVLAVQRGLAGHLGSGRAVLLPLGRGQGALPGRFLRLRRRRLLFAPPRSGLPAG